MTESNTRQKLLDAAEGLLRTRGLARVSTREIGRAACVAGGAMYHHFGDKVELILSVVECSVADFRRVLENLPLQVGRHTVRGNLGAVSGAALDFHRRAAPLILSVFADSELLGRFRQVLRERNIGPECSKRALAAYLHAEQRLGRVESHVNPEAFADLLLSASFNAAVLEQFHPVSPATSRRRMQEMVRALMTGIEPRPARKPRRKAS